MDFVLGVIIGICLFMVYDNTIRIRGNRSHLVIDIHKEDEDEREIRTED